MNNILLIKRTVMPNKEILPVSQFGKSRCYLAWRSQLDCCVRFCSQLVVTSHIMEPLEKSHCMLMKE